MVQLMSHLGLNTAVSMSGFPFMFKKGRRSQSKYSKLESIIKIKNRNLVVTISNLEKVFRCNDVGVLMELILTCQHLTVSG